MIQQTSPAKPQWQCELQDAIRDPRELLSLLGLENHSQIVSNAAEKQFPMRVPRSFVQRMTHGNIQDPLLRQVLPINDEMLPVEGFSVDPVADMQNMVAPGVIHKYKGRALLITTGACAVHCRYCFRRHYPYQQEHAGKEQFGPALDYLRSNKSIREVLLSGGDPLSLSDDKLEQLSQKLADIPHISRLRIHTRQPVVLPSRVNNSLLSWLNQWPGQLVIVLHINHANELNHELASAVKKLRSTGATLLNQAVLLKGINDSVTAQVALNETLFENGVLPYYLNLLDRVQGAAHYEISEQTAVDLHQAVKQCLPGYLLPRLVRDDAEKGGKSFIA